MKEGCRSRLADYLGWLFLILAALYFLLHPNTARMWKSRSTCEVKRDFMELDYDYIKTPEVIYAK